MSDKTAIIKEAQKYLARGQIEKAIAEWDKLVKESPDANVYNTIGDLYLKKGDKNLAIDYFRKGASLFREDGFSLKALALYKKILNIDASNADSLFALGELNEEKGMATDAIKYYLASADSLAKSGKKDELLRTYDKILSLSPSNIQLRNKVAELFMKEGLQLEAAKQYLHIARLYDDKDDPNNAKLYFKKVLDYQHNNKDALLGLSSICERRDDLKQSLEYIRQALELAPGDTELSLKAAQLLTRQESFTEAMQYVLKVIEADPKNLAARKIRGEIYLNEGDKQKAWEEYSAVIDEMVFEEKTEDAINTLTMFKDIEPVETRKKLIAIYKQKGDLESAFTEMVFLGEAFILSDNSMLKDALNCYHEALQIHPDDAELQGKITDLEREMGIEHAASAMQEKSVEESLVEADIFLRYGLYEEAKKLLESLKVKEPSNIDVHLKLKALYADMGDKEQAVAECLILAALYNRAGNVEKKEEVMKAAYEIDPQDPRLMERAGAQTPAEFVSSMREPAFPKDLNIEDYSEDLSEAEFYMRQGLYEDAKAIYQRLLKLFPNNDDIKQKLSSLESQAQQRTIPEEEHEMAGKIEEPAGEFIEKAAEEFMVSEPLEVNEIKEPKLENDVLDIFEEFKKGIEKELGAEDAETHYNLGIAYKEMGLIDDSIREFQVAKDDPKKFIQSVNMLGICYMAKGMFPLAIDSFGNALKKIETRDESYWGVKFDLAEAHEKNGNLKEALDMYTEVYGWNAKFRNVSEKINQIKPGVAKPADKPVISDKQKTKKERVSYI